VTAAKKEAIEWCLSLSKLLASPEPGLETWHEACEKTYQGMARAVIRDAETVALSTELAERRLR
jgi:hypothetical protein